MIQCTSWINLVWPCAQSHGARDFVDVYLSHLGIDSKYDVVMSLILGGKRQVAIFPVGRNHEHP